jgi:hypothetical protein
VKIGDGKEEDCGVSGVSGARGVRTREGGESGLAHVYT